MLIETFEVKFKIILYFQFKLLQLHLQSMIWFNFKTSALQLASLACAKLGFIFEHIQQGFSTGVPRFPVNKFNLYMYRCCKDIHHSIDHFNLNLTYKISGNSSLFCVTNKVLTCSHKYQNIFVKNSKYYSVYQKYEHTWLKYG